MPMLHIIQLNYGEKMIGVLGGMGPLATVDFMKKIVEATPASGDQAHVPVLAHNDPRIPDRTDAILGNGPSPLPALRRGLQTLVTAGARCIAIPCNTAHHWHAELAAESPVPVLHIADAVSDTLRARAVRRVGLLATDGTLTSGVYQRRIDTPDMTWIVPTAAEQARVMAGIRAVKAGNIARGAEELEYAAPALQARGAEIIVLACTEIPLAMEAGGFERDACLDATQALAAECVAWWRMHQPVAPVATEMCAVVG